MIIKQLNFWQYCSLILHITNNFFYMKIGGHNHGESKQEHGSGNCSHKQNDGAENNHDHDHAH